MLLFWRNKELNREFFVEIRLYYGVITIKQKYVLSVTYFFGVLAMTIASIIKPLLIRQKSFRLRKEETKKEES